MFLETNKVVSFDVRAVLFRPHGSVTFYNALERGVFETVSANLFFHTVCLVGILPIKQRRRYANMTVSIGFCQTDIISIRTGLSVL